MKDVMRILLPLLVWLAGFSAVYALQGLGCALGWAEAGAAWLSPHRLALLGAWGIVVLAQIVLLLGYLNPRLAAASPAIQQAAVIIAWVGLVAALWTLQPIVTTSACGP